MKVLKKNEMIKLREQWMMMGVISNPALKPIADEAKARLERVAQSLQK